ncbi:hypothetical protein QYM36_007772 [Artemia franciscana]|uniref:Uncharacterized protein n=1 Tax=Artemia franciscana TaxID=6661 RepID=A0AA88ID28_ARTSF|nr:hypothetical protein QYM36_007772 [Artemia franciscana]
MLACDVIEPCNSPYLAPLLLVKKKDGTRRLVTDYRELNKVIKKDLFPLPLISEILDSLGSYSVFSNLDSICGYWQVLVDEDSRDVTAFSAPGFETYRYKKIPQGMCSAPAHFSHVTNRLMAPLASENVKIYLDDTLVASTTDREHLATLKKVLNVPEKLILGLKLKNTDHTGKWARFQLELLGYDFSVKYIEAEKNPVAYVLPRLPFNPYPENLATEFTYAVGTNGNNHDIQAGSQTPNSSHVITRRNMYAIIKKYVQSYLVCCQRKGLNYTPKSSLGSLPEVSRPLEMIGIDLLGPLPESVNTRNKWILVISDAFSKHVTLVALPNKTANCVAKDFVEKFMLIYGPCENLVRDQGKEFCSDILNSIAEIFRIKKMRTTSLHPQCNGMTERRNSEISNLLSIYVRQNDYSDWDSQWPYIQWCINTAYHEKSAKLKQKETYDRDAKDIRFNEGDLVLLHVPPVARHNKLDRIRWLQPYRVIRLLGNEVNFEILRVADGKTEIIHHNRLKPYVASQPWDHLTTKQFDGIKTDKPRKEVTWADDQGYNLTSSNTNISTTPILTNSITTPFLDSPNPSIQNPILPVIDFLPPSDRKFTFTETIDNYNSIGTFDTSTQPLTPVPRTPRFPIPDNLHDGNYSDQPSPFVWTPPQQLPISLPPRLESQDSSLTLGILKQSISIGSEERLMWDDYLGPEYPDFSPLTDSHALEPKQLFVPPRKPVPRAFIGGQISDENYTRPAELLDSELPYQLNFSEGNETDDSNITLRSNVSNRRVVETPVSGSTVVDIFQGQGEGSLSSIAPQILADKVSESEPPVDLFAPIEPLIRNRAGSFPQSSQERAKKLWDWSKVICEENLQLFNEATKFRKRSATKPEGEITPSWPNKVLRRPVRDTRPVTRLNCGRLGVAKKLNNQANAVKDLEISLEELERSLKRNEPIIKESYRAVDIIMSKNQRYEYAMIASLPASIIMSVLIVFLYHYIFQGSRKTSKISVTVKSENPAQKGDPLISLPMIDQNEFALSLPPPTPPPLPPYQPDYL